MQLRDLIKRLRRGWLVIGVTTVAVTALATLVTVLQAPVYEATAADFVSAADASNTVDLNQGTTFSEQAAISYAAVASTPYVLDPVMARLGLSTTFELLSADIDASAPVDTSIVRITARAASGERAAELANAVAQELAVAAPTLAPNSDSSGASIKITPIQTAGPPPAPSSPNIALNILLGILGGFALGLAIVLLRGALDARIRDVGELEEITSVPIVGRLTLDNALRQAHTLNFAGFSPAAEAYRSLRTSLRYIAGSGGGAYIITSSVASEGKTTTAVNLALALAEAGRSVVLVDADMRRPSIAEYMGLEGELGLSDICADLASFEDVVQVWGTSGLRVVPSGRLPPNPSELLQTVAFSHLISELRENYEIVLLDTPPILAATDAIQAAQLVDGALVVAAIARTRRPQLSLSLQGLGQVGARVVGIVATMIPSKESTAYGYGYGYGATGEVSQARVAAEKAS